MRDTIYKLLVNRVPGIRERYLQRRERKKGMGLPYLLWLNIQYYLLMRKSLGSSLRHPVYEEKRLYSRGSESSLSARETPEDFAARLEAFDLVSFDVFDTLLFRPFSHPADLFYLVGAELRCLDFRRLRMQAEKQARKEKQTRCGTPEVTLEEIWAVLEAETGLSAAEGLRMEWEYEKRCCFANPYMLRVAELLQQRGRRMLAVSDMYLGEDRIRELLDRCGYPPFEACFVSCNRGASKGEGGLYGIVRKEMGEGLSWVHVGDHPQADVEQAMRLHIGAYLYPNVNRQGNPYRPGDMSAVTGSLYRGLINTRLHSGLAVYSREYEYGFIYGGLFVTGFCRFIHRYAQAKGLDRLLFLSRDGAVLLAAYRLLYPEEEERAVYAYWSRLAAVKLTAGCYREEYFRRFLLHKENQGFSLRHILEAMELDTLAEGLYREIGEGPDAELTDKNTEKIKGYLQEHWQQVQEQYTPQIKAGGLYYGELLKECRSAAAVDIGWAGSGALMLDCAVNRLWKLNCPITGILAGTTGAHSLEAEAGEPFLFSGQLVSYLYSPQENRDLWKYHDPAKGHNLYWELLLGAPEGSLKGFYPDGSGGVICRFKENHRDKGRITEIHRGILDFVRLFMQTEQRIGQTIPISGRDAYAPLISVLSKMNKPFRGELEALLDDIHIA